MNKERQKENGRTQGSGEDQPQELSREDLSSIRGGVTFTQPLSTPTKPVDAAWNMDVHWNGAAFR